jgi:hypothetical protein
MIWNALFMIVGCIAVIGYTKLLYDALFTNKYRE